MPGAPTLLGRGTGLTWFGWAPIEVRRWQQNRISQGEVIRQNPCNLYNLRCLFNTVRRLFRNVILI